MASDDPWPCPNCGGTRFVELQQVTATACPVPVIPAREREWDWSNAERLRMIECRTCRLVYVAENYEWIRWPNGGGG